MKILWVASLCSIWLLVTTYKYNGPIAEYGKIIDSAQGEINKINMELSQINKKLEMNQMKSVNLKNYLHIIKNGDNNKDLNEDVNNSPAESQNGTLNGEEGNRHRCYIDVKENVDSKELNKHINRKMIEIFKGGVSGSTKDNRTDHSRKQVINIIKNQILYQKIYKGRYERSYKKLTDDLYDKMMINEEAEYTKNELLMLMCMTSGFTFLISMTIYEMEYNYVKFKISILCYVIASVALKMMTCKNFDSVKSFNELLVKI